MFPVEDKIGEIRAALAANAPEAVYESPASDVAVNAKS
jgi:hypothetical protein